MKRKVSWEELQLRQTILIARMTNAERKAYDILIKLKCPVYVQQVIAPFICDFVAKEHNFILEIDGSAHNNRDEYDSMRDAYLWSKGFTVYRLYNEEVTEANISLVIAQSIKYSYKYIEDMILKVNQQRGVNL